VTSYLGVTGAYSRTNPPAGYKAGDGYSARDGIFDPGAGPGGDSSTTSKGMKFTSITDGLSNTLMIGERSPDSAMYWGWWSVSDYDCLLAVVNEVYLDSPTQSGSNPTCVTPGV